MKNWIRGRFSGVKLRYKLVLAIYAVLLPALLVSSALTYYIDSRNARKENAALYERFAQNACTELAYLQQDMLQIADYIVVNEEIKAILTRPSEEAPASSLFWYEETPFSFVQNMLAIKNHIKTLILYPENGFAPFYISRDASVHDTELAHIRELPIYQGAVEAIGDPLWVPVSRTEEGLYLRNLSDKIVACREIFDLSKHRRLGFLVLSMDADNYTRICQRTLRGEGEGIAVFSAAGDEFVRLGTLSDDVLARLRDEDVGRSLSETGMCTFITRTGDYVFCAANKETGVQICHQVPAGNMTEDVKKAMLLPLIMLTALLLAAAPLSAFIARTFLSSTRQLVEGMAKFKAGDFNQQIEITSQDEIGTLSEAFNSMVRDIRDLVNRNYTMNLRRRESELNALQAQINPHFLYNVLDSFYWQAINADEEELAENILTLSRTFRLLLSQGNSDIPLRREMELVECYLQMQKMRFPDRVQYTISVEEPMMEQLIPKLTIQPFVENAVVHGLEHLAPGGVICVTGTVQDGHMCIYIEDNGAGMTQEEADRILTNARENQRKDLSLGHYAIQNIQERLTMRYGGDYSLRILSEPGKGTRVELILPVREREEGEDGG